MYIVRDKTIIRNRLKFTCLNSDGKYSMNADNTFVETRRRTLINIVFNISLPTSTINSLFNM